MFNTCISGAALPRPIACVCNVANVHSSKYNHNSTKEVDRYFLHKWHLAGGFRKPEAFYALKITGFYAILF
jgi:hypothetical protein